MERGLESLLRIYKNLLELSAQLVLAIRGAVMRRRQLEVLFNALNCPRRDRDESALRQTWCEHRCFHPFRINQNPALEYFHLCESGDFNSNYGVSIIIFRCDTSRCASKQADWNAPNVSVDLWNLISQVWHSKRVFYIKLMQHLIYGGKSIEWNTHSFLNKLNWRNPIFHIMNALLPYSKIKKVAYVHFRGSLGIQGLNEFLLFWKLFHSYKDYTI